MWRSFFQEELESSCDSYKTIASSKCIITGIFKSLFMIYLLWKLFQEKKRVLFYFSSAFDLPYYNGRGGVFVYHEGSFPALFEVVCLMQRKKAIGDLSRLSIRLAHFFLINIPPIYGIKVRWKLIASSFPDASDLKFLEGFEERVREFSINIPFSKRSII